MPCFWDKTSALKQSEIRVLFRNQKHDIRSFENVPILVEARCFLSSISAKVRVIYQAKFREIHNVSGVNILQCKYKLELAPCGGSAIKGSVNQVYIRQIIGRAISSNSKVYINQSWPLVVGQLKRTELIKGVNRNQSWPLVVGQLKSTVSIKGSNTS